LEVAALALQLSDSGLALGRDSIGMVAQELFCRRRCCMGYLSLQEPERAPPSLRLSPSVLTYLLLRLFLSMRWILPSLLALAHLLLVPKLGLNCLPLWIQRLLRPSVLALAHRWKHQGRHPHAAAMKHYLLLETAW
jgi:hypothetical protein